MAYLGIEKKSRETAKRRILSLARLPFRHVRNPNSEYFTVETKAFRCCCYSVALWNPLKRLAIAANDEGILTPKFWTTASIPFVDFGNAMGRFR